jgi:hypothetical protein
MPIAGYGCKDPSGMVAPFSDLAKSNRLGLSVFLKMDV